MSDYELKRINALPEASAINDSDVFAIDSAAGTKKVAWETLKGEVDADITEAVSNKADADGTYPDMAVGSVLGTNSVTDKEPYFLRPSASIGDREFDTLVGGTLGWNQLSKADFTSTSEVQGIVRTASEDRTELTYTGTATVTDNYTAHTIEHTVAGHRYLITLGNVTLPSGVQLLYSSADTRTTAIYTAVSNTFQISMKINSGAEVNFTIKPQCFDLTTLFGATIADYIYSLEQATAGAGVAWVKKYLPNDYYAYCAPTLKHVSGVSAHVMTGFNQWDEEWELGGLTWVTGEPSPATDRIRSKNFCKCLPNTTYYAKTTSNTFYGFWYDADKNFIGYDVTSNVNLLTTPSNAHYFKIVDIGETTGNNICVNISDPTRNGEYEPYVSHSYPIDSTWVGMGVPKLDSDNKLYFDGDTYASDGTVTERFGIRAYQSGDESLADAITDGTNTVYKLTAPTTSTASPFTSPQICDPDGTEEYVTSGLVPVGHETEYVENLADKLTDIPDLPTTAGNYHLAVTVDGGTPSYAWVADE